MYYSVVVYFTSDRCVEISFISPVRLFSVLQDLSARDISLRLSAAG